MKKNLKYILMAVATVAMALCLMVYLNTAGSLPGAENTVAADGSYTAAAEGFGGGEVTVTLTIADGRISAVEIDTASQTPSIGGVAGEQLAEAILAAGSANVDAVSGATLTCNAIIEATEDCLAQARG